MVEIYSVFVMIHVFSAIAWVATLPVSILLRRSMEKISNLTDIRQVGKFASLNTYLSLGGILGVLISGGGMVGADWFRFTSGNYWLALKQVFFFLAVGVVLVLTRQRNAEYMETLEDENSSKEDIIADFKKLEVGGHIALTFVFLNIILGTLQPF